MATKKLALHRETIRTLDTESLDGIHGGAQAASSPNLIGSIHGVPGTNPFVTRTITGGDDNKRFTNNLNDTVYRVPPATSPKTQINDTVGHPGTKTGGIRPL